MYVFHKLPLVTSAEYTVTQEEKGRENFYVRTIWQNPETHKLPDGRAPRVVCCSESVVV